MQNFPESQDELSLGKPEPKKNRFLIIVLVMLLVAVGIAAWFALKPLSHPSNSSKTDMPSWSLSVPAPIAVSVLPAPAETTKTEPQSPAEAVEEHRAPVPDAHQPSPQVQNDDTIVRAEFIEDLARWLVNGYVPSTKGKGHITISLQEADMRYGIHMKGLRYSGKDVAAGRRDVLAYVMTPAMVDSLYGLYVDRLMEEMAANAAEPAVGGKALTAKQQADMYRLYASRFRILAGVLEGIASMPPEIVSQKITELHALSGEVITADSRYGELAFAQEQARERGNQKKLAELNEQLQRAAKKYQQAVIKREKARKQFSAAVRGNAAARQMQDDDVIYVAQWVERRIQAGPIQFKAVSTLAGCLRNLAERFSAAASTEDMQ